MQKTMPSTVCWAQTKAGPAVRLIDQTLLPGELVLKDCYVLEEVCEAIKSLRVRGAPAIGCSAALGVALAVYTSGAKSTSELISVVEDAAEQLAATRPTAFNLFWALERMRQLAQRSTALPPEAFRQVLLEEAQEIVGDDLDRCRRIGQHGAELVPEGASILTHCNAGALATAGHGTALGVIRAAHQQGKDIHVWAKTYMSGPTRRARCCRARGSPPGSSSRRTFPVRLFVTALPLHLCKRARWTWWWWEPTALPQMVMWPTR